MRAFDTCLACVQRYRATHGRPAQPAEWPLRGGRAALCGLRTVSSVNLRATPWLAFWASVSRGKCDRDSARIQLISMTQLTDSLSLTRGGTLANRFVLAPMTNGQSHDDGRLGEDETAGSSNAPKAASG